jgi:hypothetical protein
VTNKFHLSNGRFHLSRTIGQTLLSRPGLYMYTRVIISRAENVYHGLDLSFCIVNTHQLHVAWNFRVSVWDRA